MRLAIFAGLLLFCAPARAGSSSRVMVDPRIELLGVVQYLAGRRPVMPLEGAYRVDVESSFGALREHPVVLLYRESLRRSEDLGVLLFYFSAPPALTLQRSELRLPYMKEEGDKERVQRFLWELRDFAVVSDFASFFKAHQAYYREIERSAVAELSGLDPAAAIEDYLGLSLYCKNFYILSPLYVTNLSDSFILPYPDPEPQAIPDRPRRPFEVYSIMTWAADRRPGPSDYSIFTVPSASLWHEPLYVFIDPSFHHFEALNIPRPEDFYGEDSARCRQNDANCLKGYVVAALVDRLSRRAWKTPLLPEDPASPLGKYARALSARLEQYEALGKNGGTLWDFYPRLFSVFSELGRPAAPAPPLRAGRPVLSVADFFDRAWRRTPSAEKSR